MSGNRLQTNKHRPKSIEDAMSHEKASPKHGRHQSQIVQVQAPNMANLRASLVDIMHTLSTSNEFDPTDGHEPVKFARTEYNKTIRQHRPTPPNTPSKRCTSQSTPPRTQMHSYGKHATRLRTELRAGHHRGPPLRRSRCRVWNRSWRTGSTNPHPASPEECGAGGTKFHPTPSPEQHCQRD